MGSNSPGLFLASHAPPIAGWHGTAGRLYSCLIAQGRVNIDRAGQLFYEYGYRYIYRYVDRYVEGLALEERSWLPAFINSLRLHLPFDTHA